MSQGRAAQRNRQVPGADDVRGSRGCSGSLVVHRFGGSNHICGHSGLAAFGPAQRVDVIGFTESMR